MSHVVPQTTKTARLHVGRRHLTMLSVLLVVAAAVAIALIAWNGGSSSTAVQRSTPSVQRGGPNEAARGQAAASAAGVPSAPSLGGPDESARGQAVHSAVGATPVPQTGRANVTLHGRSAVPPLPSR